MSVTVDKDTIREQTTRLVAKAWADEGFKDRLLADPAATVRAEGVPLPAGFGITVREGDALALDHDESGHALHVVLPRKPVMSLTDEDLDAVAGGSGGNALSPGAQAQVNNAMQHANFFPMP